jgi:hypothetical protein
MCASIRNLVRPASTNDRDEVTAARRAGISPGKRFAGLSRFGHAWQEVNSFFKQISERSGQ